MTRKQMYRNEVYALLDPAQRPHLRFGQAIMNAYPDYFKGPNPSLWYATDDNWVIAFMEDFFEKNQVPYTISIEIE